MNMKPLLVLPILVALVCVSAQAAPELPRVYLDTMMPVQTGQTWNVAADCSDLQSTIDKAALGDTIRIPAGARCVGNFLLRHKTSGSGWIVIRTSTPDSQLPAPGNRVTPNHSPLLAAILSPNVGPAVATDLYAHHYRLLGLEISVTTNPQPIHNYDIVTLGTGQPEQDTLAEVAHDLVMDRCYVHGTSTLEVTRGVTLSAIRVAVIDSWISDIHSSGFDAQAIGSVNGPGPVKIVNNYLEGSGENVMFGGAEPALVGNVPSDIEIRHNYLRKPWSWRRRTGSTSPIGSCNDGENYAVMDSAGQAIDWYVCRGTSWVHTGVPVKKWAVKNLFELKNARRVLFDGNVLENNWLDAQTGYGILFNGVDGSKSTIEHVTVTNNIMRNSDNGVNVCANCGSTQMNPTHTITFANNLFENIGGILLKISNGTDRLVFDHNTGFNGYATVGMGDGPVAYDTQITNNIMGRGQYGMIGSSFREGTDSLNRYLSNYVVTKNVLADSKTSAPGYPAGNEILPDWASVGFVDFKNGQGGNYRLAASSPYRNAGTDGKDLGADMAAILAATDGVTDGYDFTTSPTNPSNPVTTNQSSVSPRVYPNPWRSDRHATRQVNFDQLGTGAHVTLFTMSGHKIRRLAASAGSVTWDLKNEKGGRVASGIYLYAIEDADGRKARGKLAVVR